MMISKYIRLQWGGVVLWDSLAPISHALMAELLNKIPGDAPISAGFVSCTSAGRLQCYGESQSLNLRSLPDDTAVLLAQLGHRRESVAPAPQTGPQG